MRIKAAMPFCAVIAAELRGLTSLCGDCRRAIGRLQLLVNHPRGRDRLKRHQAMIFGASSIIGRLCEVFAALVRRVGARTITKGIW
jgi:hypothetical protein